MSIVDDMNEVAIATPSTGRSDGVAVLESIERAPVNRLHIFIIGLCACGFAIDLVEMALGGALSAIFSARPYRLDPAQLSWLVSSVYFGAFIGAPVLGWIADKIGPRKVLCVAIFWCGIASLLSSIAATPGQLAMARLIGGIGLGAYPPLMITFLTDISPSQRRGAVIFSTCAIAYLAPPLAIFAVRWLTPIAPLGIEGWRWPFAVAGVLALGTGLGFLRLPEAPHWLATSGQTARLRAVADRLAGSPQVSMFGRQKPALEPRGASLPGTQVFRKGTASPALRLLILAMISFTVPIATVSFPLLTGPILMARHFSLQDTLFYIGLATFGPVLGTLLSGIFVDRFARRSYLAICAGAMLASVCLFFLANGVAAMATALIGFALFTALYMPTMTMFGAELFAPAVRARATSLAWVANRIAAAGAPILLIPLVHLHMTGTIGLVLGLALFLNLVIIIVATPR